MAKPTQDELKVLKQLHKDFTNTLDLDMRNRLMLKMVSWFTNTIPFVRSSFNADQEKALTMAEKIRGRAVDPRTPAEEQDTALRMTIRYMENALNHIGVPVLAETIKAFEAKAPAMQAELDKKLARFQPLVATLNGVFGDFGLTFQIDDRAKTIAAAPGQKVLVNPDTADELAPLDAKKLFFRVAPVALKAFAVTIGTQGNVVQDFSKYTDGVARLLNFVERTIDPTVVPLAPVAPRPVPSYVAAAAATTPRATRTSKKSTATGSANPYHGSKAQVWDRLRQAGSAGISIADLYEGLSLSTSTQPIMIWHITSDGKKNGRWSINYDRKAGIVYYKGV